MSIDLNKFFRLGLDTTDKPIDQSLIVQLRTSPDNVNKLQKKVTFKIPKNGILTKDTMLKINLVNLLATTSLANNRLNVLNGILGSINRVELKADNKIITSRELPSYTNTNLIYSQYTNIEILNYWKHIIGCGLALTETKNTEDEGSPETLKLDNRIMSLNLSNVDPTLTAFINPNDDNINGVTSGSKTRSWGIPLWLLSPFFMSNQLPLFLMRATRDVVLEVYFNDSKEFLLADETNGQSFLQVDLDNIELCSTHILQDPDLEALEIEQSMTKPKIYNYNDEYLIKYKIPSGTTDINETLRLNLNTRRLNRFLMCFKPIRNVDSNDTKATNQVFAEQLSTAFGDQTLQVKMNGLELFQQPINNDPTLFHLTTLYNNNLPLQFTRAQTSFNTHMATRPTFDVEEQPNRSSNQMLGTLNYLGVSVTNGNPEPLFSSSVQTTPLEIQYTSSRNTQVNTGAHPCNTLGHFMLIYPQVFKELSITPKVVNVTY
jgi:hypothetical protein